MNLSRSSNLKILQVQILRTRSWKSPPPPPKKEKRGLAMVRKNFIISCTCKEGRPQIVWPWPTILASMNATKLHASSSSSSSYRLKRHDESSRGWKLTNIWSSVKRGLPGPSTSASACTACTALALAVTSTVIYCVATPTIFAATQVVWA